MSIRGGGANKFIMHADAGDIRTIERGVFVAGIRDVHSGNVRGFIVPGTMASFMQQLVRLQVNGLRCLGGGFQLHGTDKRFNAEDEEQFKAEDMKVDGVDYILFLKW
jgi:hypothetical protein